jgi:prepilin-type N-terminal cleavage/methylation domain-containing protein
MFQRKPRVGRRKGFTLIELLVVMSIIAVLASMVVVALNRAREVADQTDSINNLSQLGAAMLLYENAFRYMPSEEVQAESGKQAGQKNSFYTSILEFVEQQNNDPNNPKPVRVFVNPSRRKISQTAWRDYGYVGTQAVSQQESGLSAVLDSKNNVIISQVSNINGASNTALLSTLWMDPKSYNTDTKTWADKPNSCSKAENVQDTDQSMAQQGGSGSTPCIGAPHAAVNPHVFCDRHVSKIPYRWKPEQYSRIWAWNNTQHVSPP